jgi:parvulin-like peptidyl-prolyl isomerase
MTGDIPSDVKELQGANRNENFLEKAFALKNGEVSEPIVLGNNVLVLKLTGEQKEEVTDENKKAVADNITSFDVSTAQSTLLASAKVENNVQQVFFNDIMANKSN